MITYEINNGSIIEVETLKNSVTRVSIGEEKQLNLISETETEKVYQWQRFNLEKGVYEDDRENDKVVMLDGREYTPKMGRLIVHKTTQKSILFNLGKQLAEAKIESMRLSKFISNIASENAKTKIEIMKFKKELK